MRTESVERRRRGAWGAAAGGSTLGDRGSSTRHRLLGFTQGDSKWGAWWRWLCWLEVEDEGQPHDLDRHGCKIRVRRESKTLRYAVKRNSDQRRGSCVWGSWLKRVCFPPRNKTFSPFQLGFTSSSNPQIADVIARLIRMPCPFRSTSRSLVIPHQWHPCQADTVCSDKNMLLNFPKY